MPRYHRYSFLYAKHISVLIRESVYCTSLTRMVSRSTNLEKDQSRQILRKFSQSPLCTGRCGCCLFLHRNHIWFAGKKERKSQEAPSCKKSRSHSHFLLWSLPLNFQVFFSAITSEEKVEKRVVFDHPFLPSAIEFWGSKYELLFCFSLRGQFASAYHPLQIFLALTTALSWRARCIVSSLASSAGQWLCDSHLYSSSKRSLAVFSAVVQMSGDFCWKQSSCYIQWSIKSNDISTTLSEKLVEIGPEFLLEKKQKYTILMSRICDGYIIAIFL